MSTPEEKLAELGLTLPEAAAPVANYVPYVILCALCHEWQYGFYFRSNFKDWR